MAELAASLAASGVDVEVIAPHEGGLPRGESMGAVAVRRFRYFLPASLQGLAYGGGIPTNLQRSWVARVQVPFFLLAFWWRALGAVRRADVVHAHWTASGLVARLATAFWRRPLVLSVRGSDAKLEDRGMAGYLNQWVWASMDRVLTVSEDIARIVAGRGVPADRIRVVPNGVSRRFAPMEREGARRQLELPPDAFVVLYVGLLVPVKGLDVLVRALGQWPDPAWTCVLVGDGPLRPELAAQADRAGIGARLRFAGRRPSDEMPLWLNAADVLVLPSLSEGRPNVVLEAQACGLPVIATRVGGTPEVVVEGQTALLVEPGDVTALAEALRRLAREPQRRREMGEAARHFIESSGLTWDASSRAVMAVYEELLGAGGAV
ncbi:MAG: glycosyltransferase [Gemmatimonadota bacterium]